MLKDRSECRGSFVRRMLRAAKQTHCLCDATVDPRPLQAINQALSDFEFMPDANSNALNTDGLASVTFKVNDLGFSGDGGPQVSKPLTIELIFDAVNDPPLVNGPADLEAKEDIPVVVPGLSVADIDSDEPGGKFYFSSQIELLVRGKRR